MIAVADTANNRVLFWSELTKNGCYQPAGAVVGQPKFDETGENRRKMVDPDGICRVYVIHPENNKPALADSGDNRVMLWTVSS